MENINLLNITSKSRINQNIKAPHLNKPFKGNKSFEKVLSSQMSKSNSSINKNFKNKLPSKLNLPENNKLGDKDGIDLAAKKAAREFENYFLNLLWQQAFKSSEGAGVGREFFQQELLGEITKEMEVTPLNGLGEEIYEEIKKQMLVK